MIMTVYVSGLKGAFPKAIGYFIVLESQESESQELTLDHISLQRDLF